MAQTAPLDLYLDDCRNVLAVGAGTAETSFYPALSSALNAVGRGLKPRIFALHHTSGKKAGIPDFGLFEVPARKGVELPEWEAGIKPQRGVIEVKGLNADIGALAASAQVRDKYLPAYGLVLTTNLRQFRLLAPGGAVLESFDLAGSEAAFRALTDGVRPDTLRTRFEDFLQHGQSHSPPPGKTVDICWK